MPTARQRFSFRRLAAMVGAVIVAVVVAGLVVPHARTHTAIGARKPSGGRALADHAGSFADALRTAMAARSPAERERRMHRLLAELLPADLDLALDLVSAQSDAALRCSLRLELLRIWAGYDPHAAAAWALRRPFEERVRNFAAVLAGVVRDPAAAVAIANRAIRDDPELAAQHGDSLIAALAETGDFAAAAAFALNSSGHEQTHWVNHAFHLWTDAAPAAAAAAALAAPAGEAHDALVAAVFNQWSDKTGQAAVEFASRIADPSARRLAYTAAMPRWARQDVVEAAAWLNDRRQAEELDEGVAAVATNPALMSYRPASAMEWAVSVLDRNVRSYALVTVFTHWAETDAAAATAYLNNSTDLTADDRSSLAQTLAGITTARLHRG